jgi:hypothetical protein
MEDDEAGFDPLAELTDEELEQELTIAASHTRLAERYEHLLAELARRRGAPDPRD